MTSSTFFHDGYKDAKEGKKPSPSSDKNGFTVNATEYMEGYNAALDEPFDDAMGYEGSNDMHSDTYHC